MWQFLLFHVYIIVKSEALKPGKKLCVGKWDRLSCRLEYRGQHPRGDASPHSVSISRSVFPGRSFCPGRNFCLQFHGLVSGNLVARILGAKLGKEASEPHFTRYRFPLNPLLSAEFPAFPLCLPELGVRQLNTLPFSSGVGCFVACCVERDVRSNCFIYRISTHLSVYGPASRSCL